MTAKSSAPVPSSPVRFRAIAGALALWLLAACAETAEKSPDPYRTIAIGELETSLPPDPIAVGFDVDDTLLFSSPGFHYGQTNIDGPDGSNRYGDKPLDNDTFWADLDRDHDAFSLPKKSALALVALHVARGDKIWAVTARPGVPDAALTSRIERWFQCKLAGPVVFTALGSKTEALRERNISVFYGDSDGDIEDAIAANARPIRLLRSPMSTHPVPPQPGAFGEVVLKDSSH